MCAQPINEKEETEKKREHYHRSHSLREGVKHCLRLERRDTRHSQQRAGLEGGCFGDSLVSTRQTEDGEKTDQQLFRALGQHNTNRRWREDKMRTDPQEATTGLEGLFGGATKERVIHTITNAAPIERTGWVQP